MLGACFQAFLQPDIQYDTAQQLGKWLFSTAEICLFQMSIRSADPGICLASNPVKTILDQWN